MPFSETELDRLVKLFEMPPWLPYMPTEAAHRVLDAIGLSFEHLGQIAEDIENAQNKDINLPYSYSWEMVNVADKSFLVLIKMTRTAEDPAVQKSIGMPVMMVPLIQEDWEMVFQQSITSKSYGLGAYKPNDILEKVDNLKQMVDSGIPYDEALMKLFEEIDPGVKESLEKALKELETRNADLSSLLDDDEETAN